MQFAPHGVRVARKAVSRTSAGISKSLSQQPLPQASGIPGAHHNFSTNRVVVSNLFTHSRNLFSRLFARLLAPNLRIPLAPSLSGRALHTSVLHAPLGRAAVKQGFSFPVRVAVSRPFGFGSCVPRAPIAAPRVVTNLGIGSIRNFTSSQPLFQNLVQNVPIAVRALYEAKIDAKPLHGHPGSQTLRSTKTHSAGQTRLHRFQNVTIANEVSNEPATSMEELERYFPLPEPTVTTYLLVPLAPTPTSRMPLASPSIIGTPDLLHPLAELGNLHISHELHALRVSSLFSRLDHEDVWSKGVHCSAFAHGTAHIWDDEGSCTILKLDFIGWNKAEVKSVIGECGTGWCILYEEHDEFVDGLLSEPDENGSSIDPAQSLVLPTLDLSSNPDVRSTGLARSTQSSHSSLSSIMDSDPWSEVNLSNTNFAGDNTDIGWYAYGLSSQFLDRTNLPF